MREEAIDFIIKAILAGSSNIELVKREAARKYKLGSMIKKPEILARFPKDQLTPKIKELLLKKPTKTLSGVTPVAVMIRPQDSCNHACIYCPFTGKAAKSYTGLEPAAMRSIQNNFDPFSQTSERISQYVAAGHSADKCEVIIMGGTFLEMDEQYKYSFIKGVYEGLNNKRSETLDQAISENETSPHRAIGLTIETRPDACPVDEILSFGATRVELGVQHPDDDIYKKINRGHTVSDVIQSTANLKNSALKVLYHIMPGLPGSNPQKDISMVKQLFENPDFRPDMLKIYPTLVLENTELFRMMESGNYSPYPAEEAADIISEFYRYIPKYVRVMRIQRDIPANKIEGGVRKSNLREMVESRLREKGIVPNEIRYREVGLNLNSKTNLDDFILERFDYEASKCKEIFLSFEKDGFIAAFLRLRFPDESSRPEIDGTTALIRELHVYGTSVPINSPGQVQHQGFGIRLLQEAEKIAQDNGRKKMVIISGVGVREYYAKHGYSRLGPYMSKILC